MLAMKSTLLILCVLYSFQLLAYTKDKVYKITILHTNDHHGRFWSNPEGELGLAARASLIKKLREDVAKAGGFSMLLDAGDVNTGIPQSDLQNAEPDFKGMALLGYDVMALGNHEFDNDLATIFQQRKWAGFPFVSANIYYKKGDRVFPSHVDRLFGDLKVTIFGLTTEDTPLKTNPLHTKELEFRPAFKEAIKIVPDLRKNTDILIGLTHVGHHPNESHGNDAPGDVTIARSVKGIDLIVGGHTQKPLYEADVQNGTLIVQAFEWGKFVGKVDLEFVNGKLTLKKYELIPVNYKEAKGKIAPEPRMLGMMKVYQDIGNDLIAKQSTSKDPNAAKVLAHAAVEFQGKREVVRFQETNLGNLVSYAFKNQLGADIGLMNSGGIRDSIPAGTITYEAVMIVLPFVN
jgi:5'-nucleotidase / UDP-sugar diphosphatase